MTIIVKYDEKGIPLFRSTKGVGSSGEERQRARELDDLLKTGLEKLAKKLIRSKVLKKQGKGNVKAYWELGELLRRIFESKARDGANLVDKSEKHLFWLNISIHTPKYLTAKNRGANRNHIEYCFRLAGLPQEKALRMNWGEWVYLFDSPNINKEHRFDRWFETKIDDKYNEITREVIRLFAKCINAILNKIETKDLNNDELIRCYEGAWLLALTITKSNKSEDETKINALIKDIGTIKRNLIGELMIANLNPHKFVNQLLYCSPIVKHSF